MSAKKVEYIEDPEINARMAARNKELRDKPIQEMTVAERLTIRALERRETLLIESEAGDIELVVRLPLASEFREIEEIRREIQKSTTTELRLNRSIIKMQMEKADPNKIAKVQRELDALQADAGKKLHQYKAMIADFCIDDSITVEFLESGQIADEDIALIYHSIQKINQERAKEAQTFRAK